MPNRIIKESICTSDSIDTLSWFEEVVFYRLIVNCDDYGRFDGRMPVIKNRLFPLKESVTAKSIKAAIDKLAIAGLVALYEFEGKPYLYLPTWDSHQQMRAKRSKYPSPEGGVIAHDITCNQVKSNAPVIQSESETESESECGKRKRARAQFIPPTVEQVREYCEKRGNGIDPEYFIAHYSKQNWRTNGNVPITDWKSCVITWEKRDKQKTQNAAQARPAQTYASSNVFFDMLREEGGF